MLSLDVGMWLSNKSQACQLQVVPGLTSDLCWKLAGMKGDEMMPDVDMDEMEMMAPPSAPPSSARLSDGGFDDALTPLDMGDEPVPYDVQVPELELEDSPGYNPHVALPTAPQLWHAIAVCFLCV